MKLKKSLFGGYNKNLIDSMIEEWKETEQSFVSRMEILESELKLSKNAAQEARDDAKKEVNESQEKIKSLRTEMVQALNEVRTLTTKLDERNEEIAQLSKKLKEKTDKSGEYEKELKRIGELYIEAKKYAQEIKDQARQEAIEIVNKAFEDISNTKFEYDEFIKTIEKTADSIRRITEGFDVKILQKYGPFDKLSEQKNLLTRQIMQFEPTGVNNSQDLIKQEDESVLDDDILDEYKEKIAMLEKKLEEKDSKPESIPEPKNEKETQKQDKSKEESKMEEEKLFNDETYNEYFAKLERKYSKDISSPITVNLESDKMDEEENTLQDKSSKKPSIKDILDKYSNLK